MSARFIARQGDSTVGIALERVGEPLSAIDEGRVFVDRRRVVRPDEVVAEGVEIVVQPARAPVDGVSLLGEFRDLYAVLKPAGLSTEPDRQGGASVVRAISEILRAPLSALHAATRLDAAVSGIVVIARGHDAARRVATMQREGRLHRRYVALAQGRLTMAAGVWDAPIGSGPRGRPVAFGKGARPARTAFSVVAESRPGVARPLSLLLLDPETGRPHQLRVHAALASTPLLGDGLRGGSSRVVGEDGSVEAVDRIALHAGRVEIGTADVVDWSVSAPPPDVFSTWFSAAGGDPAAVRALALYESPGS